MELDYKAIGQRIKDARAGIGMSQERLAELAGLSMTHTSHIETGNTKVSLPALVQVANALNVSLDDLVCDSLDKAKTIFENEITQTVQDCSEQEIRVIADMIIALKSSLRKRSR
jgi:transcriptional regulator with XRE-family HTH domain